MRETGGLPGKCRAVVAASSGRSAEQTMEYERREKTSVTVQGVAILHLGHRHGIAAIPLRRAKPCSDEEGRGESERSAKRSAIGMVAAFGGS